MGEYNPFKKIEEQEAMGVGDVSTPNAQRLDTSSEELQSFEDYGVSITDDVDYMKKQRAENQSAGEQALRAVAKIPVNATLEFGKSLSTLADVEAIINPNYSDYENDVYDALDSWQKEFNEEFAIYRANPSETFDFGDSGWWLDNLSNTASSALSFVASSYVTGAALSSITKALGSLSGLRYFKSFKNVKDIAKAFKIAGRQAQRSKMLSGAETLANSIMGVHFEGYGVGLETGRSTYDLAIREGKSVEEAKKMAADASALAYNFNRLNYIMNLSSASAFTGGFQSTRKKLSEMTLKNTLKQMGTEGVQEAIEENINHLAQKYGETVSRYDRKGIVKDTFKYLKNNFIKDAFSEEAQGSMFWGAVGGIGQTGFTAIKNVNPIKFEDGKFKFDKDSSTLARNNRDYFEQQKIIKALDTIAKSEGNTPPSDALNSIIEQTELNEKRKDLLEKGELDAVKSIDEQILMSQAFHSFKNGTTDNLISMYEELGAGEAKDWQNDNEKSDEYYKKKSSDAVNKITEWEKIYNETTKYINHQEVFYTKLNINSLEREMSSNKDLKARTKLQEEVNKKQIELTDALTEASQEVTDTKDIPYKKITFQSLKSYKNVVNVINEAVGWDGTIEAMVLIDKIYNDEDFISLTKEEKVKYDKAVNILKKTKAFKKYKAAKDAYNEFDPKKYEDEVELDEDDRNAIDFAKSVEEDLKKERENLKIATSFETQKELLNKEKEKERKLQMFEKLLNREDQKNKIYEKQNNQVNGSEAKKKGTQVTKKKEEENPYGSANPVMRKNKKDNTQNTEAEKKAAAEAEAKARAEEEARRKAEAEAQNNKGGAENTNVQKEENPLAGSNPNAEKVATPNSGDPSVNPNQGKVVKPNEANPNEAKTTVENPYGSENFDQDPRGGENFEENPLAENPILRDKTIQNFDIDKEAIKKAEELQKEYEDSTKLANKINSGEGVTEEVSTLSRAYTEGGGKITDVDNNLLETFNIDSVKVEDGDTVVLQILEDDSLFREIEDGQGGRESITWGDYKEGQEGITDEVNIGVYVKDAQGKVKPYPIGSIRSTSFIREDRVNDKAVDSSTLAELQSELSTIRQNIISKLRKGEKIEVDVESSSDGFLFRDHQGKLLNSSEAITDNNMMFGITKDNSIVKDANNKKVVENGVVLNSDEVVNTAGMPVALYKVRVDNGVQKYKAVPLVRKTVKELSKESSGDKESSDNNIIDGIRKVFKIANKISNNKNLTEEEKHTYKSLKEQGYDFIKGDSKKNASKLGTLLNNFINVPFQTKEQIESNSNKSSPNPVFGIDGSAVYFAFNGKSKFVNIAKFSEGVYNEFETTLSNAKVNVDFGRKNKVQVLSVSKSEEGLEFTSNELTFNDYVKSVTKTKFLTPEHNGEHVHTIQRKIKLNLDKFKKTVVESKKIEKTHVLTEEDMSAAKAQLEDDLKNIKINRDNELKNTTNKALVNAKYDLEVVKAYSKTIKKEREEYYYSLIDGTIYERVTSLIYDGEDFSNPIRDGESMENYEERLKKKGFSEIEIHRKKILASSTRIGTAVDSLVRSFFLSKDLPNVLANKLVSKYVKKGLATKEELEFFLENLQELKREFDERGEVVISDDVTLFDPNLEIAGTVDLITYDAEGNIKIYDMKTMRSNQSSKYGTIGNFNIPTQFKDKTVTLRNKQKITTREPDYSNGTLPSNKQSPSKKEKHQKQLSTYSILLNNTFGIKTTSTAIIPIKVYYEAGGKDTKELYIIDDENYKNINTLDSVGIKKTSSGDKEIKRNSSPIYKIDRSKPQEPKQPSSSIDKQIAELEKRREEELSSIKEDPDPIFTEELRFTSKDSKIDSVYSENSSTRKGIEDKINAKYNSKIAKLKAQQQSSSTAQQEESTGDNTVQENNEKVDEKVDDILAKLANDANDDNATVKADAEKLASTEDVSNADLNDFVNDGFLLVVETDEFKDSTEGLIKLFKIGNLTIPATTKLVSSIAHTINKQVTEKNVPFATFMSANIKRLQNIKTRLVARTKKKISDDYSIAQRKADIEAIKKLDSILDNSDQLVEMVKSKLSSYADIKFKNNNAKVLNADNESSVKETTRDVEIDEESTSNEGVATDEQADMERKQFNDDSSIRTDQKAKISSKLKRFLGTIDNPETGILGQQVPVGFDEVWQTLRGILTDSNPSFKEQIEIMQNYSSEYPWINNAIAKLREAQKEGAVEVNQFVSRMSSSKVDMRYTLISKDKNGNYSYKSVTANLNSLGSNIKSTWENNIRRLYDIDSDNELVPNEFLIKSFVEEADKISDPSDNKNYQAIIEELEKQKYKDLDNRPVLDNKKKRGEITDEEINSLVKERDELRGNLQEAKDNDRNTKFKTWLDAIGIELSEGAFNRLKKEGLSYSGKKRSYDELFQKNGLVDIIKTNLINTLAEVDGKPKILTNETSPLSNNAIMSLAKLEGSVSKRHFSEAFKNIEGNTIQSNSISKYLTSRVKELSESKDEVDALLKLPFTLGSEYSFGEESDYQSWLEMMNNDDQFREVFKVVYDGGIDFTTKQDKPIAVHNESDREKEIKRINLFFDQIKKGDRRKITVPFLTVSDNKTSNLVDTLAHEVSVATDDNGYAGASAQTVDLFYEAVVLPELRRINDSILNGALNVKGFDDGAYQIINIPTLNKYLYKDFTDIEGFNVFSDEVTSSLKEGIKEYLDGEVEDTIKEWRKLNILKVVKGEVDYGNLADKISSNYMPMKPNGRFEGVHKVQHATLDYIVNSQIANMNMYQMFADDIAMAFKGSKFSSLKERLLTEAKKEFEETNDEEQLKELKNKIKNIDSAIDKYDLMQYLSDEDFESESISTFQNSTKRLAAMIAPSLKTNRDITDDLKKNGIKNVNSFGTLFMKDKKIPSRDINKYKKLLKAEDSKAYESIEGADAAELTTFEEFLVNKVLEGVITASRAKELLRREDNETLRDKDIEDLEIFSAGKPVYAGTRIVDGRASVFTYVKSASFPLIKQYVKNNELKKILDLMNEAGVQRAVHGTAVKLGFSTNPVNIYNDDGTLIDYSGDNYKANQELIESNIRILNRKDFGKQLEVPFDSDKAEVNDASQQKTLLFGNIKSLDGFEYDGKTYTGEELEQEYLSIYKKFYEEAQAELFNELTTDGKVDVRKLQKVLLKAAEDNGWSPYEIIGLEITEKDGKLDFAVPLHSSLSGVKIQYMMNSVVDSRVRKQKMRGNSFVLGSEEGYRKRDITTFEELSKNQVESITYIDGYEPTSDGGLRNIVDVGYAEVIMPLKLKVNGKEVFIKDVLTDDGKFVDPSKIDPEVLEMFGFRIPTQGFNSMAKIKVVGFLPKAMGDLLIAPRDFTIQMGSDFDIDKLYVYMHNVIRDNNGKIVKKTRKNFIDSKVNAMIQDLIEDGFVTKDCN